MGELDSSYSSSPLFVVMMRNSRGKLFVYVAVVGILCFIVLLLSTTHTSLKELEGVNEKCQQQRDSLSAQLQVVYEHKNRLEKSLQQEKTDHKHTREGNEKQISDLENKFQKEKEEKRQLETKITQLKTSYSELEDVKAQSENALKQQMRDLEGLKQEEIKKLQAHINDLLAEKENIQADKHGIVRKLEQHTSEMNLCNLQLQQAKSELTSCQEQLKKPTVDAQNLHNVPLAEDGKPVHLKEGPVPKNLQNAQNEIPVLPVNNPVMPKQREILLPIENPQAQEATTNITAFSPRDKASVLDKPRVMPSNNQADGVLPKPLDLRHDDLANDIDAANEIIEPHRKSKPVVEPLVYKPLDPYAKLKDHLLNQDLKNDHRPVPVDNHPQVAAPNLENVEEKEDHAAERGEDGVQYNPEARPQVEQPALGKHNPQPKDNNDIVAQVNDMMNKSPGEVNNAAAEHNVLRVPPHLEPQNREGAAFVHRGGDAQRVMDEKNYEEDDDDHDNDDEPLNGLAPVVKGVHNILQDNDFEDQENQENAENPKEEGVVIAPK